MYLKRSIKIPVAVVIGGVVVAVDVGVVVVVTALGTSFVITVVLRLPQGYRLSETKDFFPM